MTDRKKHINRLIGFGASVLVILIVVSLYASFGFLEKNYLNGVEYTVLDMSTENSLLDSADVRYPLAELYPGDIRNMAMDSVSLQAIEEHYRSNPFVRDCRTYIDKHYTLQIEILERLPLVRIYSQNGGDYYIDDEGVSMPVSDHFTPRTLLATGYIPLLHLDDHVDSSLLHQNLFALAEAIKGDQFMSGFINEIHVDEQSRFVLYPLVGDFVVRINKIDQNMYRQGGIEAKFENLKIFLRDGLSRLGWDKYSEIVIDYNNQIIGKKIVNP